MPKGPEERILLQFTSYGHGYSIVVSREGTIIVRRWSLTTPGFEESIPAAMYRLPSWARIIKGIWKQGNR